jgi:hypothetical protein
MRIVRPASAAIDTAGQMLLFPFEVPISSAGRATRTMCEASGKFRRRRLGMQEFARVFGFPCVLDARLVFELRREILNFRVPSDTGKGVAHKTCLLYNGAVSCQTWILN